MCKRGLVEECDKFFAEYVQYMCRLFGGVDKTSTILLLLHVDCPERDTKVEQC